MFEMRRRRLPRGDDTTSTDLSPISLSSASSFERKLRVGVRHGRAEHHPVQVWVMSAARYQDAAVDLRVADV